MFAKTLEINIVFRGKGLAIEENTKLVYWRVGRTTCTFTYIFFVRYVVRSGPVLNYCFGRRRRSSAADQLALQVRKLCGGERPGAVHGYPVPQQSSVLWGGGFGGGGDSSKSLPLELLEPLISSLSHVRPLGIQM